MRNLNPSFFQCCSQGHYWAGTVVRIARYPPPALSGPPAPPPPQLPRRHGRVPARGPRGPEVQGGGGLPPTVKTMMFCSMILAVHVVLTWQNLHAPLNQAAEASVISTTQFVSMPANAESDAVPLVSGYGPLAPSSVSKLYIKADKPGSGRMECKLPAGASTDVFILHVWGPLTRSSATATLLLDAARDLKGVADLWVLYQQPSSSSNSAATTTNSDAEEVMRRLQDESASTLNVFAYSVDDHKLVEGCPSSKDAASIQSGLTQWASHCLSDDATGDQAPVRSVWLASPPYTTPLAMDKIASLIDIHRRGERSSGVVNDDEVLTLDAVSTLKTATATHTSVKRLAIRVVKNASASQAALCPTIPVRSDLSETAVIRPRLQALNPPVKKSTAMEDLSVDSGKELTEEYTLVTGFYDLGREKWSEFPRTLNSYFEKAERVMRFPNAMVIYTSPDLLQRVKEMRARAAPKGSPTVFVSRPLDEVPYYSKHELCKKIMASDAYKDGIGREQLQASEYSKADYDIVNWAKAGFLEESAKGNPFNTTHFAWIDFGAHDIFFEPMAEVELHKLPIRHKVTEMPKNQERIRFLTLDDPSKAPKMTAMAIAAARHDVILGPIFGGRKDAVLRFTREHAKAVDAMLAEGVVSDDQDLYYYMYQRTPDLFEAVLSATGWHGLFAQF